MCFYLGMADNLICKFSGVVVFLVQVQSILLKYGIKLGMSTVM